MPANTREFTDRKPRADARRNRERILKVAKQEFTRSGVNASLVVIVRQCCRNQAEVNLLIVGTRDFSRVWSFYIFPFEYFAKVCFHRYR